MKWKFSIATSLAVILTMMLTSLALAADPPAQVVLITDLPPYCPVNLLASYTDPNGVLQQFVGGSTPWTIDTLPSSLVSFTYQIPVVCDGVTYSSVTFSPGNPITSGATGTSTTVIGQYLPVVPDTTPPVLTLPLDMTVSTSNAAGTVVNFSASALDAVDGPVPVTCSPASGSVFPLGTTSVACSATDAAGNTAGGSFNVIVTLADTTPPVWTLPADFTVEATGPDGAVVTYDASATDPDDAVSFQECLPLSGTVFALGTTTVHCTATDTHGNTSTGGFNVTVVPAGDTTPPDLTVPANILTEATSPAGAAVSFSASANDNADGAITPTCVPASGSMFPLGTTTVECSATDTHGNIGTASFHITVVDTTPPTLSVPANITVEATGPAGAAVSFSASANDLVDGAITPVCVPASGSTFPFGTTLVTCSATDAHSNTASASFNVTVMDTTPPALTLPSNTAVTAWDASGAVVSFTALANDLVDGPVAVTCSPTSGSMFPIGITTVNCSASDSRGNTANGSFTVAVQYAAAGFKCSGLSGHQVLQPINSAGSSVFKQGSTIPVKFRVCGADGKSIVNAGVITSIRLMGSGRAVLSTTSDTGFRAGNQQWIFNLSTKNLVAGNTYVYLITLNDGSTIQLQFSLK